MTVFERWLALLALSLLCSLSRSAVAAEGSAPIVRIEVEGTEVAVERLRATAGDVLGRLGVVPVVAVTNSPGARSQVPLVEASVDLRNQRAPSLVVRDGATGRELERRTLASSASLETSVEAVVLVVYMVVEARLSEEKQPEQPATPPSLGPRPGEGSAPVESGAAADAPSTNAPVAERAPPPVATPRASAVQPKAPLTEEEEDEAGATRPSTPSAWSLSAGALLRVGTLDNESPITGAGLLVEARGKRSKFGGLLLGAVHIPSEVQYEPSRADVQTLSARLLATQGFELSPRFSGMFGLGPGIDWLRSTEATAPAAVETRSAAVLDPIISAALGARVELGGHALLMAAASLDLDLAPHTFVIAVGDERHTLLAPDRLRPSLVVAIAYTSGSEDRSSAVSRGPKRAPSEAW